MEYTMKDIKEGMKLICVNDGDWTFWTKDKVYVVKKTDSGTLYIKNDDGKMRFVTNIVTYLNNKGDRRVVRLEVMDTEENKIINKEEENIKKLEVKCFTSLENLNDFLDSLKPGEKIISHAIGQFNFHYIIYEKIVG